jgi:hypothetical protein
MRIKDMATIYVSEETRKLLVEVSVKDSRTQDGTIKCLCKERIKALAILEAAEKYKM